MTLQNLKSPNSKMPRRIRSPGYLVKTTTIATVKKAIVVIKMLWPQRAISPIICNSNEN
jgi:hypothetical protein